MTTAVEIQKVETLFPVFRKLNDSDRSSLYESAQVVALPVGQMLMQQNQHCQFIPLVLEGSLRVYTLSENGREMTLFRTLPGETCLMSIACQIKQHDFPALAQVEEDCRLMMVPAHDYHRILAENPAWKDFIILTLYDHLTDVMETLEAIAFSRTDKRLAEWLLSQMKQQGKTVRTTHESIAIELGTAREVVSRLLGELRNRGAVSLGRGRIHIINANILNQIVETSY